MGAPAAPCDNDAPMRRMQAAFEDFGRMILFAVEAVAWAFRPPFRPELIISQMAFIGVGSAFIVGATGLSAGMVFALQMNYALKQFAAEGFVGGSVSFSPARELAPVFTMLFNVIGYGGGYLMGVYVARIPVGPFIEHTREFMNPSDIMHGLFKAVVFGAIVSVITTWRGYAASGGAKGVGEGTTRGVVMSSIAVLLADYVITFIAVGT